GQGVEGGLVEDLGHEAHVLVDEDLLTVAGGDARGLLSAVLEGVQSEVRELGDLLAGSPDPEDAACVLGAFLAGHEIVVQSAVSAQRHAPSIPCGRARSTSGRCDLSAVRPAANGGAGSCGPR